MSLSQSAIIDIFLSICQCIAEEAAQNPDMQKVRFVWHAVREFEDHPKLFFETFGLRDCVIRTGHNAPILCGCVAHYAAHIPVAQTPIFFELWEP